ncbi:MAG: hypothetical protein IPG55_13615 [Saprospiraceae bacterium]|nr:hypothetical protein [Candidatus Defluviibacterium haderslevense]
MPSDGLDWFENKCSCNLQRYEGSGKQNGFKHSGSEYKSGKALYRKDGSVLFGSHSNSVIYMKQISERTERKETTGFVLNNKNILVTPEGVNTQDGSRPQEAGYFMEGNSKFCDPVENKSQSFKATVHNHPTSGDQTRSIYDAWRQLYDYPNSPVFIIGMQLGSITSYDNYTREYWRVPIDVRGRLSLKSFENESSFTFPTKQGFKRDLNLKNGIK